MSADVFNEYAARVGDAVTHTRKFSAGALCGVIGAVIGGALTYFFPPAAPAGVALILEASATVTAWIGAGKTIGEVVGSGIKNKAGGDIAKGSPTIAIGLGMPKAARLSDALKCHPDKPGIATGSKTVFMDVPCWNAARRLDWTTCGGQINSGCESVFIGGVQVQRPGTTISESAGLLYKIAFITNDAVSVASGLQKLATGIAELAEAKHGEKASTVAGVVSVVAKGIGTANSIDPVPGAGGADKGSAAVKAAKTLVDLSGGATPKGVADGLGVGVKGAGYVGGSDTPSFPSAGKP